ncbi:MAG: PDZ domain-containing protein [Acidobacteriota bacterium]
MFYRRRIIAVGLSGLVFGGCVSEKDLLSLRQQVKVLEKEVEGLEAELERQSKVQVQAQREQGSADQRFARGLTALGEEVDSVERAIREIQSKTNQFVVRRDGNTLVFTVPGGERISLVKESRYFIGIRGGNAREYVYDGRQYRGGVQVTNLTEGFPAQKAGIRVGDIIVFINGEVMENMGLLSEYVAHYGANDLTIQFLRNGEMKVVTVKPRYAEANR